MTITNERVSFGEKKSTCISEFILAFLDKGPSLTHSRPQILERTAGAPWSRRLYKHNLNKANQHRNQAHLLSLHPNPHLKLLVRLLLLRLNLSKTDIKDVLARTSARISLLRQPQHQHQHQPQLLLWVSFARLAFISVFSLFFGVLDPEQLRQVIKDQLNKTAQRQAELLSLQEKLAQIEQNGEVEQLNKQKSSLLERLRQIEEEAASIKSRISEIEKRQQELEASKATLLQEIAEKSRTV